MDKNGQLSEITPLSEHGYGMEQEVMRILKLSPKWTPGLQGGKNVRVQYILPLKLKLEGE